jgi:MFS family permease
MPKGELLLLGVIAFCCMSVEGCMFDWTGIYFRQVVKADEALVSSGYAAFMMTMSGGRFLGDRMSTVFGRRRWVMVSGLLIFTGLLTTVVLPYLVPAVIGCLITGFGVSSIIPLMYGTAGRDPEVPGGIAIATVAGVGYLGFLLGPPVIGYMAELFGLRSSFLAMSIGGIAINALVRKVKRLS